MDIQQFQKWKYPKLGILILLMALTWRRYADLEDKGRNSFLEELPHNEEEQLYGLSLLREPRNAT